jgi:hypothetical protein
MSVFYVIVYWGTLLLLLIILFWAILDGKLYSPGPTGLRKEEKARFSDFCESTFDSAEAAFLQYLGEELPNIFGDKSFN